MFPLKKIRQTACYVRSNLLFGIIALPGQPRFDVCQFRARLRVKFRFFYSEETVIQPNGMWFLGPSFLHKPEKAWPPQRPIDNTTEERRRYVMMHTEIESFSLKPERFSKWSVFVRAVAILYRFMSNCRRTRAGLQVLTLKATKKQQAHILKSVSYENLPLSSEEFEKADMRLLV